MVIDRVSANRFIAAYMAFLGTLVSDEEKHGKPTTEWLVIGRARYAADRGLLDPYLASHSQGDAEMLDAISAIQVGRWVYLKDTRSYSVLLVVDGSAAYATLGLNDRLRELAQGHSGVVMVAGLVRLAGRWVCDGLLEDVVYVGPNMRREFTETYQELRKAGLFHL